MYKLTVVSGPNRGSTYGVKEGETSIGRQAGNSIVLPSSKISKKHCVLLVNGQEVLLRDEGSSNGTFVNGALIKSRSLKPGERISIGEYVLELTQMVAKPSQKAPVVSGFGNPLQFSTPGNIKTGELAGIGFSSNSELNSAMIRANEAPKDLKGKIFWYFEHTFMPIIYNINLKNEWKIICISIFSLFILGNLIISVYPILESSRAAIVKESGRRAQFMAQGIVEKNAPFLAARAETKTEIGMVENAEGVRVAVLVDLDSRILAPGTKLNQYLASGEEAIATVKARDLFRSGRETGVITEKEGIVIAVEPVKIMSAAAGKNIIVGMAIVSVDTTLATPDLGEMGMVYAETLILTGLFGGIILLILYKLTLKPFQVLNEDMDKALKGDISQVTREYKFEEMNSLWDIINSAIQRIPKSNSSLLGSLTTGGDYSSLVEEYLGPLKMIGDFSKFGLMIFDSNQKIVYLNSQFEEASGIRSESALGQEMSVVARDQSMVVFTKDILSRAPTGGEGVSEDYDFSGISYKIYAGAFGSLGGQARCYLLAAVRIES